MAIAQIDPEWGHLTYAAIGNIEARLWQDNREQRLISYRGIVGGRFPTVRLSEFALSPDWLLLIHTDGISARFELNDVPELASRRPQAIADAILHRKGRQTDDRTIVVVCVNAGCDR